MLQRWRDRLHRAEDLLLSALVLILILLGVGQIVQRQVFEAGWIWAEPLSRTLVMWIAMLGALAATREHRHIAIDALPRALPPRARRIAWCAAQAFAATISAGLAWYALQLVRLELEAPVPLFGSVPSWVGMLVLPLGFALMAIRFALSSFLAPEIEPASVDATGNGRR